MTQDNRIAEIEQTLAQLELSRGQLQRDLARVEASLHYYKGQLDLLMEQRSQVAGAKNGQPSAGRVLPDVAAPGGPVETP